MKHRGHLNGAQRPTNDFPVPITGEAFERLLVGSEPVHIHHARLRVVQAGDVVWVTNAHDPTLRRRTMTVKVVCISPDMRPHSKGGNLYVGLKRTSVKKPTTS